MEADENGIGNAVGDADAFAEGDKGIVRPGHFDFEPLSLEFFFETISEVEGEGFFFAERAAGSAIMSAVPVPCLISSWAPSACKDGAIAIHPKKGQ